MVFSADDLVVWRDFPKGLRVLLLDQDGNSAAETKSKLEAMDYVVSPYCNVKDALEAISSDADAGGFHVAIIEVTSDNCNGSFKFLEVAKDLPTVAISDVYCLSTMMKCIALGAAEFLQKPLSEDKIRNIWQHVVHKAFNAGGTGVSKSLRPIKETVASILQLHSDTNTSKNEGPNEKTLVEKERVRQQDRSEENDKFSAPSTPQLDIGGTFDDELPNCSNSENTNELSGTGKSSHSNSKSIDNTSNSLLNVVSSSKEVAASKEVVTEEEVTSENGSKTDECGSIKDRCRSSSHMHNGGNVESGVEDQSKKKSFLGSSPHSHGNKYSKRKVKVDWTPELHKRFVRAVEQLGIDQAIPSKILELMKVEGLTRHNIASHLQKYRMQRRHILPKDDERRWQANADSYRTCYTQKPVIAVPHIHPNCGLPPSQGYPFWGHPSYYANGAHTWGPPAGFQSWHPPHGSWFWKATPAIHADAWGCPVVPPYSQFPVLPQVSAFTNGLDATGGRNRVGKNSYDSNLAEEMIDEVVKEAMSKPWLPLPLGLKPPSVDSVLTELQRQGIPTIPNSA